MNQKPLCSLCKQNNRDDYIVRTVQLDDSFHVKMARALRAKKHTNIVAKWPLLCCQCITQIEEFEQFRLQINCAIPRRTTRKRTIIPAIHDNNVNWTANEDSIKSKLNVGCSDVKLTLGSLFELTSNDADESSDLRSCSELDSVNQTKWNNADGEIVVLDSSPIDVESSGIFESAPKNFINDASESSVICVEPTPKTIITMSVEEMNRITAKVLAPIVISDDEPDTQASVKTDSTTRVPIPEFGSDESGERMLTKMFGFEW